MGFLNWLKREVVHVLPVFLFFLIFFTLINWIESYLFKHMGVTPFRFAQVALAAALIAKVVLVADKLTVLNLFRKKPLAFGIVWKTMLYWLFLLVVRFVIRMAPYLTIHGMSFHLDGDQFFTQVNWNLFISIQAYYLMLLFIFITFQELATQIGPEKMRRMFFGR